jgi:sialate O-acetylesterase
MSMVDFPLRRQKRFRCPRLAVAAALAAFTWASPAGADVRLPGLFSDNMVLQAGMPAPVWGWADPGEQVTVSVNDQTLQATADEKGAWRVRLEPVPAGTPLNITIQAGNTITIRNATAGEVWLCSGQSQIEQGMRSIKDKDREVAQANDPGLRLFVVPRIQADAPQAEVLGQWLVCTPKAVSESGWRGFSAIGYFFGRDLRQRLNVPVGVIQAAIGGTPIEVWMDGQVLQSAPAAGGILEEWKKKVHSYDPQQAQQRYEQEMGRWKQKAEQARAEGKALPAEPKAPVPPTREPWYPASRYNAMIAPLAPYGLRGVLWYQGYSSRYRSEEYKTLFPLLIQSWRRLWGQGDFAFYYVQHANFATRDKDAGRNLLAAIREAQASGLREPNTGMVVSLDLGESKYLHYSNKRPVARRLADMALAKTYGRQEIICQSPIFREARVEGKRMLIGFDHVFAGLKTRDGQPIDGFQIAGADGRFVPAQAERAAGDTIAVWSEQVSAPRAVRYAWADDPVGANLCNSAGLPAAPFRTDNWPLTAGATGSAPPKAAD